MGETEARELKRQSSLPLDIPVNFNVFAFHFSSFKHQQSSCLGSQTGGGLPFYKYSVLLEGMVVRAASFKLLYISSPQPAVLLR